MTETVITFLCGLLVGCVLSYLKYVLGAEKTRYDVRTKILREVWEAVLLTKSLAVELAPEGLDPEGVAILDDEPRDETLKRRMPEFLEQHLKAKKLVRFNSPFYPRPLHDLANDILKESKIHSRYVMRTPPASLSRLYWDQIKSKTTTLNEMSDQLDEAIRQEINRPALPFGKRGQNN